MQQGLDGVTPRLELAQAGDRTDRRFAVEHGRAAGREVVDVAAEYRRVILAGLADRQARDHAARPRERPSIGPRDSVAVDECVHSAKLGIRPRIAALRADQARAQELEIRRGWDQEHGEHTHLAKRRTATGHAYFLSRREPPDSPEVNGKEGGKTMDSASFSNHFNMRTKRDKLLTLRRSLQ